MPNKWEKDQARMEILLARRERLDKAKAARRLAQEREIVRDQERRLKRQRNK